MTLQHKIITPATCDITALTDLINRIRPLYLWFSTGRSHEEIIERLTKSPNTHIDLLLDGEIVAAFAVCVPVQLNGGEMCLFRHGTIIGDMYRSQDFYKKLLRIGLERHRPNWHATRTQNPRVYETWLQLHGDTLLPSIKRQPTTREKTIARTLAKDTEFEDESFVSRNVYQYSHSAAEYNSCRSSEVRLLFERFLGSQDAFILLAPCTPKT